MSMRNRAIFRPVRRWIGPVCLGIAVGAMGSGQGMAERLAIESKTLSAKAQVPTRGMRMEQVEKRFGVPESKLPAEIGRASCRERV